MARISKTDHPRILHLVDVDRRKVVEVAAEYGCTPANIYALLGKVRRAQAAGGTADGQNTETASAPPPSGDQPHGLVEAAADLSEAAVPSDLFAEMALEALAPLTRVVEPAAEAHTLAPAAQPAVMSTSRASATAPSSSAGDQLYMTLAIEPIDRPTTSLTLVKDEPRRGTSTGRAGTGGTAVKSGFGLTMRTADGDETVTPFRSLDDLLSAIKPILRASARSPDAVWFSIQPIDLATLEVDAA